jgi:hypothetical protein
MDFKVLQMFPKSSDRVTLINHITAQSESRNFATESERTADLLLTYKWKWQGTVLVHLMKACRGVQVQWHSFNAGQRVITFKRSHCRSATFGEDINLFPMTEPNPRSSSSWPSHYSHHGSPALDNFEMLKQVTARQGPEALNQYSNWNQFTTDNRVKTWANFIHELMK